MWTCSKCGGKVGDQFTTCQSCGTNADGTTAPLPTVDILDGRQALGPPPDLRPIVPPPASIPERLLRAAKAGAMYGGLYGAMFVFILWVGRVTMMKFPEGAEAALGEGLVKGVLMGAGIGVPVAVIFRLIFPYKR